MIDEEGVTGGDLQEAAEQADQGQHIRSDALPENCRDALSEVDSRYVLDIVSAWDDQLEDFQNRARELRTAHDEELGSISAAANARIATVRSTTKQELAVIDKKAPWARLDKIDLTQADSEIELGGALKLERFKEHYWKFGLAALVAGWIALGSFVVGLATGLAAMAGYAAVLRSKYNETIGEKKRIFFAGEDAITELNRECEAAIDDCAERIRPSRETLIAEWREKCDSLALDIGEVHIQIEDIIERANGRFSPFSPNDPLHYTDIPLDEQVTFRLGQAVQLAPNELEEELASWLKVTEQPATLGIDFPEFFDLADKRALIVHGQNEPASKASHNILGNVMSRILRQLPPGKATFTLFDPLGLGANFASFLRLQDFSDALINGTVWTGRDQIRRQLEDLIGHVENVTQRYLRADYPDIESYNRDAGEIAEPYRFLVVCDFPEGFGEDSIRDLLRLVQNGPRCGIHTLLYWNHTDKQTYGLNEAEFLPFGLHVNKGEDDLIFLTWNAHDPEKRSQLIVHLDAPEDASQVKRLVDSFGANAVEAMKVEIPFDRLFGLAKIGKEWWSESARDGISAPLGPIGAKKALTITFDSKLSHNALIVGRPGSGKSNLLHVFISMVTHRYSPDEVELYLIDFKKGVEFKDYANSALPHARVIAVESEREFGISVLRALDKEMTTRSELFKQTDGAESIGEYRKRKPDARMPRAVLIVDEFQEFFTKEDKIKEEAALLFDRIVRQGRSFGVHVILGTQSLSNSGLSRSTIDQIPIRIALQCSETDSRLILSDDNIAARGLSRPGEALYNDKGGLVEGNRQFQVAIFPSDERKAQLADLAGEVARRGWDGDPPRIFEGHESASLGTCKPLREFRPAKVASALKCWLGEPVSLDDPVFVELPPQAGRNMLVVAREERQAVDVMLSALASLTTQLPPRDLEINIVDLTTADAEWAEFPEAFRDAMPHSISVCGKHELRDLLPSLADVVSARQAKAEAKTEARAASGQRKILVLLGAHRARDLRMKTDSGSFFSLDQPAAETGPDLSGLLRTIIADGPDHGVHTFLWIDSIANLERILDRRLLDEFGIRVSGALPDKDSHYLFDNQIAAQIAHPNRMVKYDDERVGVFNMFRPYKVPSEDFFDQLRATLFEAAE